MNITKEQIKAVMLGHAIGDALGVPVEFCEREELSAHPVTDMLGYGTYPYPEGCWSDDTSMSLAALDSLVSCGVVDSEDIMLKLGKWYYNDEYTPTGEMFDVGNTCSAAIENYFVHHKPVNKCGLNDEYYNGNGSLMRIHPFVLYAYANFLNGTEDGYWKWMGCIKQGSAITHAHERAIMGCHIYADCLSFLLKEATKVLF